MLRGNVSAEDKAGLDEILKLFNSRKQSYDKLLVESALVQENGIWKNFYTRLLPLSKEEGINEKILNYGDFLILRSTNDVDDFPKIVSALITQGKLAFRGSPEIVFDGIFEQRGNLISSDDEHSKLGWPSNLFKYVLTSNFYGRIPGQPLLKIDKPLFPDGFTAIFNVLGIDLTTNNGWQNAVIISLPNYKAKINNITIGSKYLTIKVTPKELPLEKLIGKLYCAREHRSNSTSILFPHEENTVATDFKPETMYFCLLDASSGENIDKRDVSFWWLGRELPKDVIVEMDEDDIMQTIGQGENNKIEFKEQIGQGQGQNQKIDELVESIVAFSNCSGGVVLVGVNDNSVVVGTTECNDMPNTIDRITNILRSRCEPPIEVDINKCILNTGNVLIIRAKEGHNKPYCLRDKGIYIRAGGTDRIATRAEVDEIYEKKKSLYNFGTI
jgi:hypothetical protein